ncbi:sugar phosphate isomerase [Opitutaceae bacterium TAV5]|nr:sugar phosphate isomerase [Opitutaceae bacterium TAV5]
MNTPTSFDLARKLGIKTYSFRTIKEIPDLIAAVKKCGVDGVDLSACHVNYDDVAEQEKLIGLCRESGIRISGIGVTNLKNDEAFNRRFFAFAQRSQCGLVSCSFEPQDHETVIKMVERFCGEYGVHAAIHNHGGRHWLGNPTALRYVFEKCSKQVGLCLDTAWCLQAAGNPMEWLDMFGERLYGVHFKDLAFTREGKCQDVVVGQGALDLPAFIEKFRKLPFDGSVVVEFEGEDPVEQSARCVTAIRAVLAGQPVPSCAKA